MEISKKMFMFCLIMVFTLGSSFSVVMMKTPFPTRHKKATAHVFVIFETAKGGTWFEGQPNVLTNIGERYVANVMGLANVTNVNATQWIALGNHSTPAITDTKLDTEATTSGFTRSANDTATRWMNGTDYATNISCKFTASATIRINATSLHFNPTSNSDNNAIGIVSITETTFNNNDNCTIVWVFTWDLS